MFIIPRGFGKNYPLLRYSVVNGEVQNISSIDNMHEIRKEIRGVLSNYEFANILEILFSST